MTARAYANAPQQKDLAALGRHNAVANIAVTDMGRARRFYEETLGLDAIDTMGDHVTTYQSGNSKIYVYRSDFAGTNKATAMTWDVDDIEGTAQALKGKGVAFEHYTMPDMRREGDIHIAEGVKAAWFKDPDGNILSIVSD